jgi:hypothetical protein
MALRLMQKAKGENSSRHVELILLPSPLHAPSRHRERLPHPLEQAPGRGDQLLGAPAVHHVQEQAPGSCRGRRQRAERRCAATATPCPCPCPHQHRRVVKVALDDLELVATWARARDAAPGHLLDLPLTCRDLLGGRGKTNFCDMEFIYQTDTLRIECSQLHDLATKSLLEESVLPSYRVFIEKEGPLAGRRPRRGADEVEADRGGCLLGLEREGLGDLRDGEAGEVCVCVFFWGGGKREGDKDEDGVERGARWQREGSVRLEASQSKRTQHEKKKICEKEKERKTGIQSNACFGRKGARRQHAYAIETYLPFSAAPRAVTPR